MDQETFDKALSNDLPKLMDDLKRERSARRFRKAILFIMIGFYILCLVALISTFFIK